MDNQCTPLPLLICGKGEVRTWLSEQETRLASRETRRENGKQGWAVKDMPQDFSLVRTRERRQAVPAQAFQPWSMLGGSHSRGKALPGALDDWVLFSLFYGKAVWSRP